MRPPRVQIIVPTEVVADDQSLLYFPVLPTATLA